MKTLLAFMLLASSFSHAQVIPISNSRALVQDELFSYQWSLLNQEQTLLREKDDIHNLPLKGVIGKDIGWESLLLTPVPRRPIVAVLDSGLDLTHPDLDGNLWKNEQECGKDPNKDNDGNGYPGDCQGWNFTASKNSPEAKDVSDIDGHGTHLAGIIAAAKNDRWMVGVIPNALIMPVKVMKDDESNTEVQSSDAFAYGIIYAVDNGADVINMSIGWPKSLETKALRDAVFYALDHGVPIIAAAGNNNSTEPLFPCAYEGVICVAASTINGKFAGFSNYGGHVDTIAPGEGILGLHPMEFEPDIFSIHGLEMRSGTSQAAPIVTGLVAALKATNKDITIDEIFAKLYQAKANEDKTKYVLGGEATWNSLNKEVHSAVVRPVFKRVRQIVVRGESPESVLNIPVKNFGTESANVVVRIESLSKTISFDQETQYVSNLGKGETKELPFPLKVNDFTAESNVKIKVTITDEETALSFINEIPVVRDIRTDEKFSKRTFTFTNKTLPLGGTRNGEIVPLISTIESYGPSLKHEFMLKKTLKEEKRIEIDLFTRRGDNYFQIPKQIKIENALNLLNFIRTDLNFDGKEDYFLLTLSEKEGKQFLQFSFYNENLDPLWPSFNNVPLTVEANVERPTEFTFIKYVHPVLGKILVPAFFTEGTIPKIDQQVTSWQKYDSSKKRRLYYFEPLKSELKIRALTTNIWEEASKKALNSKWSETVVVEQMLPASKDDVANGTVRVLVTIGEGARRQISIHTFDATSSRAGSKLPQIVLQSDYVDPYLSVTDQGLNIAGDVYFNIYDRTRARLVVTKAEKQASEYVLRHETESDLIAGHIASFEKGTSRFSVFQSREELISVLNDDRIAKRSKLRYSFLSQKLLAEMYYPVAYKRDGALHPALYVDTTAVTKSRIHLFEEQNGELVSSVRNSLLLPTNCKALNPNFSKLSGTYEYIFLCLEGKEFMIRTLGMN